MKTALTFIATACLVLSACAAQPPNWAKKELNRAKIVTITSPDELAEALVHELAKIQKDAAQTEPLLVPDKVSITFMSAAERSASGEVKTGLEVLGVGGETTASPSASLEELQELSMTFEIDTRSSASVPATTPKIEIGLIEAMDGLRGDLKAFLNAGKDYLTPGCAKITKHFELDTDLRTSGEASIKFVTINGEISLGGHFADTLEISFKVAGHKGSCDL